MSLLIITETGAPQEVVMKTYDTPMEYKIHSLAPGTSLPDLSVLEPILEGSDADWVALTKVLRGVDQIQALIARTETLPPDTACWIPHESDSFAEFIARQLGIWMASLWFPLWKAGAILVPKTVLLEHISKLSPSDCSIEQLWVQLPWQSLPESATYEINWSDHLVAIPLLVPHGPRKDLEALDLLFTQAADWMPLEYARNTPEFKAIQAGLYLWYDDLDVSHSYSQSIEYQGKHHAGDYWHAIMHRREPDYSNSKYWYRNAGQHPILSELSPYAVTTAKNLPEADKEETASLWQGERWDPRLFVDFCSRCVPSSEADQIARQIQAIEMVLLMKQTLADARN